ncbi:hypothetical protein J5N97_008503 [Dioscorea zingiberensis]|uniref:Uncharacterized protein n=1 Tax=Dioscorea zingiberensis TaxID=325984 RepID=A0A9D5CVV4_9LILI|nr:hypothetical protein J5N97_008503 [Dioscorea zingiberensis]
MKDYEGNFPKRNGLEVIEACRLVLVLLKKDGKGPHKSTNNDNKGSKRSNLIVEDVSRRGALRTTCTFLPAESCSNME